MYLQSSDLHVLHVDSQDNLSTPHFKKMSSRESSVTWRNRDQHW